MLSNHSNGNLCWYNSFRVFLCFRNSVNPVLLCIFFKFSIQCIFRGLNFNIILHCNLSYNLHATTHRTFYLPFPIFGTCSTKGEKNTSEKHSILFKHFSIAYGLRIHAALESVMNSLVCGNNWSGSNFSEVAFPFPTQGIIEAVNDKSPAVVNKYIILRLVNGLIPKQREMIIVNRELGTFLKCLLHTEVIPPTHGQTNHCFRQCRSR